MMVLKHFFAGCFFLAAGTAIGWLLRPGNSLESIPWPPPVAQILRLPKPAPVIVDAPVEVLGPQLPAPDDTKPPPGLRPRELQSWMQERWREGRHHLALAAFLAVPDLTDRVGIAESFAGAVAHYEPRLIAQLVLSLPPGKDADRILSRLVREWAAADAEEALRFLAQLPPARLTGKTLSWIPGLADLPPQVLESFAAKLDEAERKDLYGTLLGESARTGSWQQTQAWLKALPVGHRAEVMAQSNMARQLADASPQTVETWLESETDVKVQDQLKRAQADSLAASDPAAGLQLLEGVSEPEERHKAASHIAGLWLFTERRAALTWLRSDAAASVMKPEERLMVLGLYGLEAKP